MSFYAPSMAVATIRVKGEKPAFKPKLTPAERGIRKRYFYSKNKYRRT